MTPSRATRSFIATWALALLGCAAGPPTQRPVAAAATVPPILRPQGAENVIARLHAQGTQIYVCQTSAEAGPAGYAWTLKAPFANLYDDSGRLTATHFAGPTWRSSIDGSAVVGAKVSAAPAPVAGAIPWLLLKVVARSGQGQFTQVVAIQRLDTVGGGAPTTGCAATTAGVEQATPYQADYYFFGQGKSASGKEGGAVGGW